MEKKLFVKPWKIRLKIVNSFRACLPVVQAARMIFRKTG